MNRIKTLYLQSPVYVVFLAAYPVVSLLAFNIDQVFPHDITRSLMLSILTASLLLLLLRLMGKDWQITGVLASLFLIWFFIYGRLYAPLKSFSIADVVVGRHRFLLPLWSLILFAIAVWLMKRPKIVPAITIGLNIFTSVLICLPVLQILWFQYQASMVPEIPRGNAGESWIQLPDDSMPPDIYYIVLDAYTRSDVLENEFGIDNSNFLTSLQTMGFEISDCATSNYTRTRHSLTSTFNMEYIQALDPHEQNFDYQTWLTSAFKENRVRELLAGLGYKTIAFNHPWQRFVWDDADILFQSSTTGLLNPFEDMLLRTTVIRVYLDLQQVENLQLPNYINYVDTLYALEQLQKVPKIKGPKLVFAHLIIPHPPFVFGPEGEKISIPYDPDEGNIYTEENYKQGYRAAVTYINTRMSEILPVLIRDSDPPPIVIIAGDHGTPWGGTDNAVKILAAFYTPERESLFSENITLVNVFRIIFDTYFKGEFGVLPDRNYISGKEEFIEITNQTDDCGSNY